MQSCPDDGRDTLRFLLGVEVAEVWISSVSYVVGGPCVVVTHQNSPERVTYHTTSVQIVRAVLEAYMTHTKVVLETVGETFVIKRVPPFAPGPGRPGLAHPHAWRVRRIATQRNLQFGDHLEVFFSRANDDTETAYNVFDAALGEVVLASLRGADGGYAGGVDLEFEGPDLVGARLGRD